MTKSTFVYTTYIRTTPEKLWNALISPEFTRRYWYGTHMESEWRAGSAWRLVFADGRTADMGEVVEVDPPRRLVLRWRNEWKPEMKAEGDSTCTITAEPCEGAMKLTIVHEMDREGSQFIQAVSSGWPKILSNLKSLLETGELALAASA